MSPAQRVNMSVCRRYQVNGASIQPRTRCRSIAERLLRAAACDLEAWVVCPEPTLAAANLSHAIRHAHPPPSTSCTPHAVQAHAISARHPAASCDVTIAACLRSLFASAVAQPSGPSICVPAGGSSARRETPRKMVSLVPSWSCLLWLTGCAQLAHHSRDVDVRLSQARPASQPTPACFPRTSSI